MSSNSTCREETFCRPLQCQGARWLVTSRSCTWSAAQGQLHVPKVCSDTSCTDSNALVLAAQQHTLLRWPWHNILQQQMCNP
jgi:hypothetical protein